MKKRAALILALVMLTGVLAGLMPVSAAAVSNYYFNIAPVSSGAGYHFTIDLAANETIKRDYNASIVQVVGPHYTETANVDGNADARVIGIANGSTTVNVVNASGTVIRSYHVTVSSSGSGTLADITGATVEVSMRLSTNYDNVFTGEKVTLTAVVKKGTTSISPSQLRYNWTVSGGINATIATSSYGSVATLTLSSVPFDPDGTPIEVDLVVYGAEGGSIPVQLTTGVAGAGEVSFKEIAKSNGQALSGSVMAYSGKVNYFYYDRDNNGAAITAAELGTLSTFTNLGRTYSAPVGRSVGMIRYMADANPRTVTFTPAMLSYDIVAGVKKGAGSVAPPAPSTGYGIYPLPNGYVIFESVENANNLAVMKPGSTQQVTKEMLGGVPPTAPLMSYKITDPKIAVVSSTGLITALTTGVTTLEVYCNNQQVIYKQLFVLNDIGTQEPEEEGLVIKTKSVTRTLATQKNVRFRVKADSITFNGKKIAHKNLEWSSSKTSVATVDANGYVRIKAKGTCYIYAVYTDKNGDEHTARFKVTVK
ncbi:MAG: Ig-like domain-containing protein [Christensenellales bacterium]